MTDNTQRITPAEYRGAATEHEIQQGLFDWADAVGVLMYAIPNGQYRKGGRPEPGLRRGIPDVNVPYPRGGYGSLYLELKTAIGRVRKEQAAWHKALQEAGNCVYVVRSLDAAIMAVEHYLEMPR